MAGLAVPYELEARIGDKLVTFARDSITPAGGEPLLLGHEPTAAGRRRCRGPTSPPRLRATYAVDPTTEGDVAIAQARSGSRRGLSVGVDADEVETDQQNPERIKRGGRLAETSLVSMAGYPTAGVTRSPPTKTRRTTQVRSSPRATAARARAARAAARPRARQSQRTPVVITASREAADECRNYVQTLIRAERGDRGPRERIEAALVRENLASNPGVVPLAYVNTLTDCIGYARPLFDAMTHADMPAAGMTIRRPIWTTRPDGSWINDTDPAPSTPVKIDSDDESTCNGRGPAPPASHWWNARARPTWKKCSRLRSVTTTETLRRRSRGHSRPRPA